MREAEDREEDASAVLRAIQVENEALQRAILSRKAKPPASPLQVRSLQWERMEDSGYSGTRRCLSGACQEHVVRRESCGGAPDLRPISASAAGVSPFPPPPFHLLCPKPKLDANVPPLLADFPTNPEHLKPGLQTGGSEQEWRQQPSLASLERPPSPEHEPFRPQQSLPLPKAPPLACFTCSGNPTPPCPALQEFKLVPATLAFVQQTGRWMMGWSGGTLAIPCCPHPFSEACSLTHLLKPFALTCPA